MKMKVDNKEIAILKKNLSEQEKRILGMKKAIKKKKFLIEQAYQYQLIRAKEDEIYFLDKNIQELQEENRDLKKVRGDKMKAIEDQNEDCLKNQKMNALAEKLRGKHSF